MLLSHHSYDLHWSPWAVQSRASWGPQASSSVPQTWCGEILPVGICNESRGTTEITKVSKLVAAIVIRPTGDFCRSCRMMVSTKVGRFAHYLGKISKFPKLFGVICIQDCNIRVLTPGAAGTLCLSGDVLSSKYPAVGAASSNALKKPKSPNVLSLLIKSTRGLSIPAFAALLSGAPLNVFELSKSSNPPQSSFRMTKSFSIAMALVQSA